MKVLVPAVSALLLAGAAQAQTAPQTAPPGSDRTRDLNSGPPAPATYIAPAPATAAPRTTPAPSTTAPVATPRTAAPSSQRPATASPVTAAPPRSPAPSAPTTTARSTATRPATTPAAVAPAPNGAPPVRTSTPVAATPPAAAPNPPPAPPSVPAVTVLNAAARAALPFTVDLPAGFEIVTGRPGPDFKIYTIRRAGKSFAMVYAGPSSQFPIYSGEMVEAGGRTSVVAVEGTQRHALEHLFQRDTPPPGAPKEVHVWTMSLDGADRATAERIAQSVDLR